MTLQPTASRSAEERDSGFSLVEIMVGLTVLTLGLFSVMTGFLVSARATEDTRTADLLKFTSLNVVAQMRENDFDTLLTEFGPGSGKDQFWCDISGTLVFTEPSVFALSGTITLYDDPATVPASFADLDTATLASSPTSLSADLGILPTRLTISNTNGEIVRTLDLILYREGF